jgi:potassium-transporting ATPase KdpC subunit
MSRLSTGIRTHLAAVRAMLVFTVILGILYPLLMTGIAQAFLGHQANGSLVKYNGKVVGSSLLCQEFVDAKGNALPQWFQPRPSDASAPGDSSDYGCDPLYSGGSNYGPNNPNLAKAIKSNQSAAASRDNVAPSAVPPDALTASFSGLDPDITPAYAYQQVAQIAATRHIDPNTVRALVASHVQGRNIGILGEQRVDVLQLNIALAKLDPSGNGNG